ncbi:uncharacterized protein At4g22758 [Momordica charantia]|uniref:Uncharacterized protein At4g22758 n=1 Tax=Momordica charantia TaxID=3673 RepID=A0A6J1DSY8_MOMCH|nr:uncharacterized protein At4g22758 [Momordica charantia]
MNSQVSNCQLSLPQYFNFPSSRRIPNLPRRFHFFMSSSSFRRRIPPTSGLSNNIRRQNLSPSPRRATPPRNRRPSKPSKFTRCSSEPNLWTADANANADDANADAGDGDERSEREGEAILFRPHTFSEAFASSPLLIPSPRRGFEGYKKDAKVVINVTVEGSPGPVRTMVKLGSSVEETIKLVVAKYGEEGRTPKLERDSASAFELHHSYFSLQSLDRAEIIGEIGSRSFYLRKSNNSSGEAGDCSQEIGKETRDVAVAPPIPPGFLLTGFIARKMAKIVRRTRKIWNFIVCLK